MWRNPILAAPLGIAILGLVVLLAGPGRAAAADAPCDLTKLAELPVTLSPLGPTILATLDGIAAPFLADTGAVFSMIPPEVATRLRLPVADMDGVLVGGVPARKASVAAFGLGSATAGAIDLMVADLTGVAPKETGVLGQNLLGVTDVEYDLAGGKIRLFQAPASCGTATRAYWTKAAHTAATMTLRPTSLLIEADVAVNGQAMHARFDTSIPVSVISLAAAAGAGITPQTAGVVAAPEVSVGLRKAPSWFAPAQTFTLGDETQAKPRLRIADVKLPDGVDMLIGADFFVAHRIYVARDLHRIEFTDAAPPG